MTSIVERYDRDAEDYERYWAPVLDQAARSLLDRVDSHVAALPAPVVVDVGTGSGVLALDVLGRWPGARAIGVDPSVGMLGMAQARAARSGIEDGRAMWLEAPADQLRCRTPPRTSWSARSRSSWCPTGRPRCARRIACSGRVACWRS
ncbi:MAG: class I SAM-dependent methyltransferase [Chloroflexota bacterium]